jgi:hypothetical protein
MGAALVAAGFLAVVFGGLRTARPLIVALLL